MFLKDLMKINTSNIIKASAIIGLLFSGMLPAHTANYNPYNQQGNQGYWQNYYQPANQYQQQAAQQNYKFPNNYAQQIPTHQYKFEKEKYKSYVKNLVWNQNYNQIGQDLRAYVQYLINLDPAHTQDFKTIAASFISGYKNNNFARNNNNLTKFAKLSQDKIPPIFSEAKRQNNILLMEALSKFANFLENLKEPLVPQINKAPLEKIQRIEQKLNENFLVVNGVIQEKLHMAINATKECQAFKKDSRFQPKELFKIFDNKTLNKAQLVNYLNGVKKVINNSISRNQNNSTELERLYNANARVDACINAVQAQSQLNQPVQQVQHHGFGQRFKNFFHRR